MYEKFTNKAREAIKCAKKEAERLNHDYIGTEHILLGIVKEGTGIAFNVLENFELDYDKIKNAVEKLAKPSPDTVTVGEIPFTPRAKKVLDYGIEEAKKLEHDYIGTEHLLLGLLRETEGIAIQSLSALGIKVSDIRKEVLRFLEKDDDTITDSASTSTPQANATSEGKQPKKQQSASASPSKTPALDSFSRDLTKLAKEGRLDPCIGRQREVRRILQILARRLKNNAVLIGEAGVGKTAIIEGLAQMIVNGEAPKMLQNKRLVELDLAAMVAGTKYRGQFEERIKAVLNEINQNKNIILFIDELHTLVGAGGAEGSIDAANTFKPALARGELQCIGATTLNEYRKYIEKDAALERRFQSVMINEPTVEETIDILNGLKGYYEKFHGVHLMEDSIEEAVKLSVRYMNERFLPDKAIDIIDEAGASIRIESGIIPKEIKDIEELVLLLNKDKEKAVSNEQFELAAEYRDKSEQMTEKINSIKNNIENAPVVDISVSKIRDVVSVMTGIPISQIGTTEKKKLMQMESGLHKTIVSQDDAISTVCRAIRRSRAGLKDPKRPVACLLFLGPTGVGKTLTAKALANLLFGSEDLLIKIDMSEYGEKHSVSRLIGAPPGYIGHDEGGQLTEKVRRKPYSVVLFDEIEKADPESLNIFLQIMEDGCLTDSIGRKVSFQNCIVIMTSNIGAERVKTGSLGFARQNSIEHEKNAHRLKEEVNRSFKPEFVNRFDDIVYFRSLNKEDIYNIVDIEFRKIQERLTENNIDINLDLSAKEFLVSIGYDKDFGARPLRRAVEQNIEDLITDEILTDKIKSGDTVTVFKEIGQEKLSYKIEAEVSENVPS